MKKIVLAIVALFMMGTMATAQIQDLGVRFGGGQGYGAEISAMWGLGGNRLETDLGWASWSDDHSSIAFSAIYQWTVALESGFSWYYGFGGRLALWTWNNNTDFALALAGQLGIEYNFDAIPLQLSLDIRPHFWLIPDTQFHWGDIAFGIRYRF